ncbi:Lipoxygenase protein [Dioscorea alata]|uniref:Lipoxygenase protein n=1 Tax=Dioscorea alata TaxID=55571 RepID=A0ACB7UY71_DIOAL|nr:Lipoxygenase protein [Dioscorea alata]
MLMPHVNKINSIVGTKIYATSTLLFLQDDGTLKPLAIELSLPESSIKVHTPAQNGIEGAIWQLAKAYVLVNDSGDHEIISHWYLYFTFIPFVIATNRQLLYPHYHDTMNINALAHQSLIIAGGVLESTSFAGKYTMEMSAVVYKSWNFMEQSLPADLIKRGVAVEDPSSPNNVQLLIKDYPYASAIHTWVTEFCKIYYPDDATLQGDVQVQAWWKEVHEIGHALHASINFSQYPYASYLQNRSTISHRFMPEPDKVFLKTITSVLQTLEGISVLEILSKHTSDEVYLGQRDTEERFGKRLEEIRNEIVARNEDPNLKNRNGPVKMPYSLLYPTSGPGLTTKGVPNINSI